MAARQSRRVLLALAILSLLALTVPGSRLWAQDGNYYLLPHFAVEKPGKAWKWDARAWRLFEQLLFYYRGKGGGVRPQLNFREIEIESAIETEAELADYWKGVLERQAGMKPGWQLVECEVLPQIVPISRLDSLEDLKVARYTSRSHEVRPSDGKIRSTWLSRGYIVLHPHRGQSAVVASLIWRLGKDEEPSEPAPADAAALTGIGVR